MDGPAISIRGLTKRFGELVALDGLDLDVPRGAIAGVLGAHGSGKSTLIRLLTGLARPTAGSAFIAGQAVGWGDAVAARRPLGVVLQGAELPRWMTGRDLLAFMADLAGVPARAMTARIEAVAAQLDVGAALETRIGAMAGPVRGRLAVAQALVGEPEILLLDDPFQPLDPDGRAHLRSLIAGMRGQRTVLLATHRIVDVTGMCDRVALLDRGRLVAAGSAAEVLRRPASAVYLVEPGAATGLAIDGLVARLRAERWVADVGYAGGVLRIAVSDPERADRELLTAVVGTGLPVAAFRREPPTLEDVLAGVSRK